MPSMTEALDEVREMRARAEQTPDTEEREHVLRDLDVMEARILAELGDAS